MEAEKLMALCAFADNYSIFDITPVDNLFIEDYMLRAPGDYVKVYLYGLRLCYARDDKSDLEQIAGVLGMESETVLNAMLFWERQGMVRRLSDRPPCYEFVNLRARMLQAKEDDDGLYAMGQFNNEVLRLLGADGRVIHGDEFARMYRWMEDYSLSETAVLRVMAYLCKANKAKGRKAPTVNAVEKFIMKMAGQKIVSDDAVTGYLHGLDDDVVALKRLLAHLGIRKDEPSAAEEALFAKWHSWGFDLDALKLLSNEMTKIQKPTLGYLDRIVSGYQEMGVRTAEQIQQYQAGTLEPVREVLAAFGPSMGFSTQLVRAYCDALAKGFEHALLVEAAHIAARSGNATLVYWQSILDRYAAAGILTMDAFLREKQHNQALRAFAQKVLVTAGDTSVVSAKEVKQVEAWLAKGRSEELILCAAELCSNSPYKLSAIGKMLVRLDQAGIVQPEAARAFLSQTSTQRQSAPEGEKRISKNVSAQNYAQRQYDPTQYDDMVLFDLNQVEDEKNDDKATDD
jgi:hypothetical protein